MFFLILLFSFFSCNIFKKNIKNEKNSDEKQIKKLTEKIKSKELNFQTFSAGFYGNYFDEKQKFPLKGLIKIQKDKFIWITLRPFLGIEVARILLTKDSVKYIDKINKKYIEENYNYLKTKLGFSFNYKIIEKLFTNKIFAYPNGKKIETYLLTKNDSIFLLQNEFIEKAQQYFHLLSFNKNNNLKKNKLALKDNSTFAEFNYSQFKEIKTKNFPYKLIINFQNNKTSGTADLNFKSIIIDKKLSAKFTIPSNYKKIRF